MKLPRAALRGRSLARGLASAPVWLLTLGLNPGLRPVLARNLRSRPGRSALTALAVCLGVAVMLGVQIDIAGVAAQARAAAAVRAGGSGLDVLSVAAGGLSPSQLSSLTALPGVTASVPLYQKRVAAEAAYVGSPVNTVTVVGIEDGRAALRPITLTAGRLPGSGSPGQVAVDASLLDALAPPGDSLGLGSTLMLTTGSGPRDFRVVGLTGAGGVGASFAQDAIFVPSGVLLSQFNLGLHTSLDALQLGHGVSSAAVATEVHRRLGGSVTTLAPGADSGDPLVQLEPILLLVSLLSVVIGAGVAANTVSLAALERRRDIGLLRAAGASAGQVFRLLSGEGLLLAIAGSVLGVGVGIGLGAGLQAAFSSAPLPAVGLQVSPLAALLAALAGALAAAAAAALPAAAAARMRVLEALNPESAGRRERVHAATLGAVPALLALTVLADLSGPAAAAVGGIALLLAVGLCLPLVAPLVTRWLAVLLRTVSPEGEVAAANLSRRRNRTALTLSGLVVAVAAAVASSILVAGSLSAGDSWVDHLFVGSALIRSPVTQREEIATQISRTAGVQVTPLVFFPAVVDDDVIGVAAIDSRLESQDGGLELVGGSRTAAFADLAEGPAVIAPVSLAEANDWQVGTQLSVETPSGAMAFRVSGIAEHSFPAPDGRETLLVDSQEAARAFGSEAAGFDDLEVLTPGRETEVAAAASRYGLAAIPISTMTVAVGDALGDTIGILPAVSWVALAIAMLAVVNTLVVSVRSGRRELALMRAVGLSAAQARRFVLAQAGYLGATAAILGTAVGCLLAIPMLAASQSPGFLPGFDLAWVTVLALAAAVIGAAVATAVLPARQAARASIVSAVRHR